MKKIFIILTTILLCLNEVEGQTPVMTMISNYSSSKNSNYFSLSANVDSTPVQVDFGNGELIDMIIGTEIYSFKDTVSGKHTIKIYGEGINYLYVQAHLSFLDVSQNPYLEKLECQNNSSLNSLDLSQNLALTELNCYGNGITSLMLQNNLALTKLTCNNNSLDSLDISQNTELTELRCYGNRLIELDISHNKELLYLDCRNNQFTTLIVSQNIKLESLSCSENQLNVLDVTQNNELEYLYCGSNLLTNLDVTRNTELTWLACSDNQLTVLDVTQNLKLEGLLCESNLLTNLDASHNTELTCLTCSENQLTVLDVTQNTKLKRLYCQNNELNILEVSLYDSLYWLECNNNHLNFASLPPKQDQWSKYSYVPQYPIHIPKNINIGDTIDFSDQYLIEGNITSYTWKTEFLTPLIEGTDYLFNNGKFVFLRTITDSVFCELRNASFPDFDDYPLVTTYAQVSGHLPYIRMTTTKPIGDSINLSMKAYSADTPIQIDFGDGTLVNFVIDTSLTIIKSSVLGTQTIKIFSTGLSYLDCSQNQLTYLYVNPDELLSYLDCSGNDLSFVYVNPLSPLAFFACNYNKLAYSTLPPVQSQWAHYIYAPQQAVCIDRFYDEGIDADLSAIFNINEDTTIFTWKTKNGIQLTEGADYINTLGYTSFTTEQSDSVRCEMSNPAFPNLSGENALKTIWTKITAQQPEIIVGLFFEYAGRGAPMPTITFYLAAESDNTPVKIDFGDGILVDKTVGISETKIQRNVPPFYSVLRIYGSGITLFRFGRGYITSLDISKNTALKKLYGFGSYSLPLLHDIQIDLTRNKALTEFECSGLSSLDVSQNILLTKLDCSGGSISQLDVRANRELETLDCSDNELSELDVTNDTALTILYCFENQISELDITQNTRLEKFNCSSNVISNLDITQNTKLKTLNCYGNAILNLNVTQNNHLEELNCSYNAITNLDLLNQTELVSLNCNANKLSVLDMINSIQLNELLCKYNELTELNLSQNNKLAYLDCCSNNLNSLDLSVNPVLKSLLCAGNQLKQLDIPNNSILEVIRCEYNLLDTLNVSESTMLKELYCWGNQLTVLDVTGCNALNKLQCPHNQIASLDLSECTALTNLNCDDNLLAALDVTSCSALTNLTCNDNQLTILDVSECTALKGLSCSNNQMNFTALPKVNSKWTSYNYAPQYPIGIYKNYTHGNEIDLSDQYSVESNITTYSWKTQYGTPLIPGTDYVIANGKTVFFSDQTDSVYCEMTNASFPDFKDSLMLKTTHTKISGPIPVITMTSAKPIGAHVSFSLKANNPDTEVQIDFGDGNPVNVNIDTVVTLINGSLIGSQTITIFGSGLFYLDCSNNDLTDLYIDPNTPFTYFDCSSNRLTDLYINPLDSFTYFACDSNRLTLLTLPEKQPNWTQYVYAPQQPFSICKNLNTESQLDLTNQLVVGGDTTLYKWKTITGSTLEEGNDYEIRNGITIFFKPQDDSVYCELASASFPDFTGDNVLKTTPAKLSGNNISVMTMTHAGIGSTENFFYLRAKSNNTVIRIDYGDGILVDVTIDTIKSKITNKLIGSCYTKIYGTGIVSLEESIKLTTIDVSRNPELTKLSCNKNLFTSLDLTHNPALSQLECYDNYLSSLDLSQNPKLTLLDCGNYGMEDLNKISSLDLSHNPALTVLKCPRNRLTSLNLSQNPALTQLDCSNNRLTSLLINNSPEITEIRCKNNCLTFATLPLKQSQWTVYSYAPQYPIQIDKELHSGVGLDLSDQFLVDGDTTIFTWKTENGAILVPDKDYATHNGITTFLLPQDDSIYCELANDAFPDFTGSQVLKTTCIKITGDIPEFSMMTLKPLGSDISLSLKAGNPNSLVRIDFGDSLLSSFYLDTATTIINGPLSGSNTIRILGVGITSIDCSGNELTYLDVTQNTALKSLNCSYNYLNFATLPAWAEQWTEYIYAPQGLIEIDDEIYTGSELDLSSQFLIDGNTTTYTWKNHQDEMLLPGNDYTIHNGITTFLVPQDDSVYCELTNAAFPDFLDLLVLKTDFIKVISNSTAVNNLTIEPEVYSYHKTIYLNMSYDATLSIFDINGSLILSKSVYTGTSSLEMTRSGIYIVRLTNENSIFIRKVLIQ